MSQTPTAKEHDDDKWWLSAKCRGMPSELFVPSERGGHVDRFDRVKAICWGRDGRPECPVRVQCGQAGEAQNEFGIWGGELRSTKDYNNGLKRNGHAQDDTVQVVIMHKDGRLKRSETE